MSIVLVIGCGVAVGSSSRWSDRPSVRCVVRAENGESGEVGGGCEEVEVGVDFGLASDAGAASAVSSAHEVPEFAFDLGSGGAVVVSPERVGLSCSGSGEHGLVHVDRDLSAGLRGRALAAQWTG